MPVITAEDLGGDYAERPVAEGKYPLRIVSAKYAVSEKGNAGVTLGIKIEGRDGADAPLVTEWVGDPGSPNGEYYKMRMRALQGTLRIFGYPLKDGFDMENDTERLIGLTGDCMLVQKEDDRDGTMRNKLRLPRF